MKDIIVYMKIILFLLVIFGFEATSTETWEQTIRQYLPEENDPYRVKYLINQDENGQLRFEDLTLPAIEEQKITVDDVTLYLYTQDNSTNPAVYKTADLSGLKDCQVYNPKKPNVFIIHGLNNNFKSPVNKILKRSILKIADCNVFVVDWNRLANQMYIIAKDAVPQIGEYVGNFINRMMEHYKLTPKDFKLIGHSLGAHVAGCAGAKVNGLVDYIIGLDPAGPLFTLSNYENRLDASDAEFVQVIHTSATTLGFGSSIGDADYYPNDGSSQPGCGIDAICAHSRSYYYFGESILYGGFVSVQCDSYKSFKKGKCGNNRKSYLGSFNVDVKAYGDYYLDTDGVPPFSVD